MKGKHFTKELLWCTILLAIAEAIGIMGVILGIVFNSLSLKLILLACAPLGMGLLIFTSEKYIFPQTKKENST